jgi:hypothetical protein
MKARGAVAGFVAAFAMAFWFLIVDAAAGVPFRTPAFLASALLGRPELSMELGGIIMFTLIHFGVFMAVGMGVSWLLRRVETAPNVLLGLVVGFLMFDLVFYLSVTVTGVDVIEQLGWPEVLAGNLIAGVCLLGMLHLTGATPPIMWWDYLAEHRIVREGIVSGLIGAAVVAFWFLLFDLLRVQPFFTPGALGSALFLGATSNDAVVINAGTVIGYTLVHLGAFIVTGLIAAAVMTHGEKVPSLLFGAGMLFVAFEAFFMGFIALVAEFLLGALAWWTILIGNMLATLAMGWYLWQKHPKVRAALADHPLDKTD